ncbi:MAG: DEAD/DEAH box helicase, partial [Actinomycetota bacterium]|nr:DEAD/DEAH box helicase [Actinomycetota bacterium]
MAVRPDHLDARRDSAGIAEVLASLAAERDRAHHADAGVGQDLGPSRLLQLVELPARPPRHAELARPLPTPVAERLPGPLWSHQAEAIDLARSGRSVVVASGTASGKSLCYQAPIAEAVAAPIRPGTGLVLFPTKALAHDQLRALTALDLP